jgi:hypothetical protein
VRGTPLELRPQIIWPVISLGAQIAGAPLGRLTRLRCPQCGRETPASEWNCVSCRINMYWASQHYGDLASVRGGQGLAAAPPTPSFLLSAHERAMTERADRGGAVEHKVRKIARSAMRAQGGRSATSAT